MPGIMTSDPNIFGMGYNTCVITTNQTRMVDNGRIEASDISHNAPFKVAELSPPTMVNVTATIQKSLARIDIVLLKIFGRRVGL